jgi:hypothetical protein
VDLPGWFGLESGTERWTNGNAKLPVTPGALRAPAAVLEIRILQAGPYLLNLTMGETDLAA